MCKLCVLHMWALALVACGDWCCGCCAGCCSGCCPGSKTSGCCSGCCPNSKKGKSKLLGLQLPKFHACAHTHTHAEQLALRRGDDNARAAAKAAAKACLVDFSPPLMPVFVFCVCVCVCVCARVHDISVTATPVALTFPFWESQCSSQSSSQKS